MPTGTRVSDLQESSVVHVLHFLRGCLHGPRVLGLEESDACVGHSQRTHLASRDHWLRHHDRHGTGLHFFPGVRYDDEALQRSDAQILNLASILDYVAGCC